MTDHLAAELSTARLELARTDTKVGIMLACAGTALYAELTGLGKAGLTPIGAAVRVDPVVLAAWGGWSTVYLTAGAVLLLLAALRPRLRGGSRDRPLRRHDPHHGAGRGHRHG